LLNVTERDFDTELLQIVGLNRGKFPALVEPGNIHGKLKKENFPELDLPDCEVINIASHDTASAVVGTPSTLSNWAYLSSGTWSLLGIETDMPIINNAAFE